MSQVAEQYKEQGICFSEFQNADSELLDTEKS